MFEVEEKIRKDGMGVQRVPSAAYRIFPTSYLSTPIRPDAYRVRPAGCNISYIPLRPTACRVRPM